MTNTRISLALIANSILGKTILISPGLPDDQWQRETLRWFETGLAKLQANTIQFVNVPFTSRDSAVYELIPAKSFTKNSSIDLELEALCSEQRIRSRGRVQNFNVLSLGVLIGVSLSIIISYEFLIPWCAHRFFANGYREWESDGLLAIWKTSVDPQGEMDWVEGKHELYVLQDTLTTITPSVARRHDSGHSLLGHCDVRRVEL